jgi:hypothetical protein
MHAMAPAHLLYDSHARPQVAERMKDVTHYSIPDGHQRCMWPEGMMTCRVLRGGAKLDILRVSTRLTKFVNWGVCPGQAAPVRLVAEWVLATLGPRTPSHICHPSAAVRAARGRLRGLGVLRGKSLCRGGVVWAWRACDSPVSEVFGPGRTCRWPKSGTRRKIRRGGQPNWGNLGGCARGRRSLLQGTNATEELDGPNGTLFREY